MSNHDPSHHQPRWKPGDVANDHILGNDNVWRPLPPEPPSGPRKPWFRRPLGITGIALGSLLVLSVASAALAGGGDTDSTDGDQPAPATTPDPDTVKDTAAEGSATAEPTPQPEPTPTPEPIPKPKPTPKTEPPTYLVTHVVDGDTVDLDTGQTVRVVGIDTPERGQCGYTEASDNMATLLLNKRVTLGESDEDTDRYGRLLRYVDIGTMDAGLQQIKRGYAIARYDSRDGYGFHPREPIYIAADDASKPFTCAAPEPKPEPKAQPGGGGGGNCMAGYAPCLPIVGDLDCGEIGHPVNVTGSDPYRLDADGDGIGCDS